MNMKMKPILFSGEMVRSILAGTKTQTRRVVKPQPSYVNSLGIPFYPGGKGPVDYRVNPYGQEGSYLRGKETTWMWCAKVISGVTLKTKKPKVCWLECRNVKPIYCADQSEAPTHVPEGMVEKVGDVTYQWRKKIGRFLPGWASRMTLEITGIRVERLREISEEDALAEGIHEFKCPQISYFHARKTAPTEDHFLTPVRAYMDLWETINGPDSWAKNPFVWVVEFKRVEGAAN